MKKYISIYTFIFAIFIFVMICSCANNDNAAENSARSSQSSKNENSNTSLSSGGVDVDLTRLNRMMQFTQLQHMMSQPENFLGKSVKIRGDYDVWCYAETLESEESCHHFIIVEDVAACCKSGIEFKVVSDNNIEFPTESVRIEVIGIFKMYDHFELTMYYLETDGFTILRK